MRLHLHVSPSTAVSLQSEHSGYSSSFANNRFCHHLTLMKFQQQQNISVKISRKYCLCKIEWNCDYLNVGDILHSSVEWSVFVVPIHFTAFHGISAGFRYAVSMETQFFLIYIQSNHSEAVSVIIAIIHAWRE